MDEQDSVTFGKDVSAASLSGSPIRDGRENVAGLRTDIDNVGVLQLDAIEPDSLRQENKVYRSQTPSASPGDMTLLTAERMSESERADTTASAMIMEDTHDGLLESGTRSQGGNVMRADGAEAENSTAVITKSQNNLSFEQKEFLIKRLMATQKRKFAKHFLTSADAKSLGSSRGLESMNLDMMLTKLLDDGYISAEAFKDDMKTVARAPAVGNDPNSDNSHSKELLDHVDNFMKKLPKSEIDGKELAKPTMGEKRKADDGADKQVAIKRAKLSGPSTAQQREMSYAKKQVIAYRQGKHFNEYKKCQNLVADKIGYLDDEKQKKRIEAAKKKHKLDNAMGLMPKAYPIESGSNREVENEDNIGSLQVCRNPEVDKDSLSEDQHSLGDEQEVNNGQSQLASQLSVDTGRRKDQSSSKANTIVKLRSYEGSLSELSRDRPTPGQIARLDRASMSGPNFLGRTAATTRGLNFGQYWPKTNGYTTKDVFLPAADSRSEKYCSHAQLTDLSQGELTYMLGNHLIWKDLYRDEFLSYSKDPLFLVVHALRRYHENQGDVTIQFLDRRKARDARGCPARFYSALDLYTIFKVPKWPGWGSTDEKRLHPRKFTQEFLSHGPVLTPDTTFQQASIQKLIDDGLYEIFPEFDTPEDHKRAGLYTLQVVYRKIGYPPVNPSAVAGASNVQLVSQIDNALTPSSTQGDPATNGVSSPPQLSTTHQRSDFTQRRSPKVKKEADPIYSYENCSRETAINVELLTIVRKVTLNFIQTPEGSEDAGFEPPLHAFICFLTFEKRQRKDPVFMEWIQKHYKGKFSHHPSISDGMLTSPLLAQDVKDLYTDPEGSPLLGMTVVANNLPGYMQYLDLVRDCIDVFSLEPLPANEVETKHAFHGLWNQSYTYAAFDHSHHQKDVKSEKYDAALQIFLKDAESRRRGKKKRNLIGSRASDEAATALVTPPQSQPEATEQNVKAVSVVVDGDEVAAANSAWLDSLDQI